MSKYIDGCDEDRHVDESRGNDILADEEAMLRQDPHYRGFFSERFYQELLSKIRGQKTR